MISKSASPLVTVLMWRALVLTRTQGEARPEEELTLMEKRGDWEQIEEIFVEGA